MIRATPTGGRFRESPAWRRTCRDCASGANPYVRAAGGEMAFVADETGLWPSQPDVWIVKMLGLFRKSRAVPQVAAMPAGKRCYAVGDIHGRLDLLTMLLDLVERDNAARAPAETYLVFLGDLIDRGAASKGVLDLLSTANFPWAKPMFLMGNHEEAFLEVLAGDLSYLDNWLRFGGFECAQSYGLSAAELAGGNPALLYRALRERVPQEHIDFIDSFYDSFALGRYVFVHAGIRPGIAIEDQDPHDLRWIRHDFLDDQSDHGVIVVHGHTVVETAAAHVNRVAIDTGAYRTGRLTAVRLEADDREFIVAEESTTEYPAAV